MVGVRMSSVRRRCDNAWFSRDSMQFWRTRLTEHALKVKYRGTPAYVFITQERVLPEDRQWSVRVMLDRTIVGVIECNGETLYDSAKHFSAYPTREKAEYAAVAVAEALEQA